MKAAVSEFDIVLLIPSRTDTRWWREHVMAADQLRNLKSRITFQGAAHLAPFPSAADLVALFGYSHQVQGFSQKREWV